MKIIQKTIEASLVFDGDYTAYKKYKKRYRKGAKTYQCRATTQKGTQCTKKANEKDGFCAFHGGQSRTNSSKGFEGVYVFKTKNKILYVGKSKGMFLRIQQHVCKERTWQTQFEADKQEIYQNLIQENDFFIELWKTNYSDVFEKQLIEQYSPQLNINLTTHHHRRMI